MTMVYRISRIIVFIISVFISIYVTDGEIIYSTLLLSILFILFDLYWPRIDYS
jgi:hypothetical protein